MNDHEREMAVVKHKLEKALGRANRAEEQLAAERERADAMAVKLRISERDYEVMAKLCFGAESERDALKAHVEEVKHALSEPADLYSKTVKRMIDVLEKTPETSLAQLKARVAAETLRDFADNFEKGETCFRAHVAADLYDEIAAGGPHG